MEQSYHFDYHSVSELIQNDTYQASTKHHKAQHVCIIF